MNLMFIRKYKIEKSGSFSIARAFGVRKHPLHKQSKQLRWRLPARKAPFLLCQTVGAAAKSLPTSTSCVLSALRDHLSDRWLKLRAFNSLPEPLNTLKLVCAHYIYTHSESCFRAWRLYSASTAELSSYETVHMWLRPSVCWEVAGSSSSLSLENSALSYLPAWNTGSTSSMSLCLSHSGFRWYAHLQTLASPF